VERLRKKLSSRRGASILIALLFLLLCMMTAASILTAAASNAGKLRSSREEQQRYLTLSSALRLVCGELERAEYEGKYGTALWEETVYVPDPADPLHAIPVKYDHHWYGWSNPGDPGRFTSGSTVISNLLDPMLDWSFAKELRDFGYPHIPLPNKPALPLKPLTVRVEGAGDADLSSPVTVTLTVDEDTRNIRLAAALAAGSEAEGTERVYEMQAELVCSVKPGFAPPPAAGGWRPAKFDCPNGGTVTSQSESAYDGASPAYPTLIKWELNWIQKGGQAGGA